MCGIIFVHRIDGGKANKSVIKRYYQQKERGSDGFGFISINKNKLVSYKRAKLESQIKQFIEKDESTTILFHHRYPTSTPNFKESAHPIKVSSIDLKYDYYLVHNGIISNADELKEKHEQLGFVYNTEITKKFVTTGQTYKETCFNDSESLAVEVALAIDKGTLQIEAKGSIAFVVAKVHKSSNNIVAIYYARNSGSPLKFSEKNELISIGSATEGTIVPSGILHKLDLKTNIITCQQFEIPEYSYHYGYDTTKDYRDYVTDGYGTTFGDDDYDIETMPFPYPVSSHITDDMKNRWNEIDWEITTCEQQLDKLEDNNDGSPEWENRIIECEAVLNSLIDEREKLDDVLTRATLLDSENE